MSRNCPQYKYLGVIFDENFNFNECEATLSDKAGRVLSSVISKFHTYNDSYVWPILDYCSSVWGYDKYKKSEQILNRAIQ